MTLDAEYVPSPGPSAPLLIAPRVMMLHELADSDRSRIQRLVANARPDILRIESEVVDNGPRDYWCTDMGTLHDFQESAQKVADVTGRAQTIHMHGHSEECRLYHVQIDAESGDVEVLHYIVEPDPLRSVAVGGNTR